MMTVATSYLNPVEIATAFNTCTGRENWHARASARSVVFTSAKGTVTLTMDCDNRTFRVTFKRTRATFVDYTKAIARALFAVLSALKAAGLPFEAPASLVGFVVESRPTEASDVYVSWRGGTVWRDIGGPIGQHYEDALAYATVEFQPTGYPDRPVMPGENKLPII